MDNRSIATKKQFVMKRFAEVNPRTNTHNMQVGKSLQHMKAYNDQQPMTLETKQHESDLAQLDLGGSAEANNE